MKKRMLSLIISLTLCLGLLPVTAGAANDKTYTTRLDFTNVGDGENQTPAEGPGYKWEGDASNGYKLTLDGIEINVPNEVYVPPQFSSNARRAGIYVPTDGPVTIELIGKNSITTENGDGIYCDGGLGITVQGTGSLTTVTSGEVVANRTKGDVVIKDVTIQANASGCAFVTRGDGNIVFENAKISITSQGTNTVVVYASNGSITMENSTVEVICTKHPTLPGSHAICALKDITIVGGTVTASTVHSGYAAIAAFQNLTISGGAKVTATANVFSPESEEARGFGLYSGGAMKLSQSEIVAEGTTAAVRFIGSLTLEGTAILEPSGGKIGDKVITNSDDSNAVSVKLGPVTLNAPSTTPTCTYGDTDTAKVTLTTTPAIISKVEIYNGSTKLCEGNLNEEITIDTSSLSAGDATLTAKLPDGLGEKEFTVKVNPKTLTVDKVFTTSRVYDGTNEVAIGSVTLNGVESGDTVRVNCADLKGTIDGTDAGIYTSVTLPELTLMGDKATNYTLTQPTAAVLTDVKITKANYSGTKTANTSAKFGVSASYDLSSLLPKGAVMGEIEITDSSNIFDAPAPSVSNNKLSYKLKADATVGNTATVKIPVTESTNYNEFDLTVTVTVLDKYAPRLTVSPITHVYNGEAPAVTGMASNEATSAANIPGTWSFQGAAPINVADSGKKTIVFTPDDGETYATATVEVQVTITPKPLSGKPTFTGGGSGKTLGEVTWEFPADWPLSGAMSWTDGDDTVIEQGKAYEYTFTPIDGNYQAYTGSEILWARPSGGGGAGTPSVTTGTNNEGGTSTTQTTAVPSASNQNGTAASTVSTSMGDEIVKQAAANKSETVVIAPKVFGSVTKTEVSVPASTVAQLGSQTSASLTVSTPVGDVTIPNGGLSSLAGESGNVTFTVERTGGALELSITADGAAVQSVPGGVTVTVPKKNTTPGTVAVLVHEDGTREVVRKSVADKDGVTVPLEGSAKVELVDNSMPFDDVPDGHWASDAVAFASAHELFNGTGPRQFSPDLPMSRGMLAVALHNLESNPAQAITIIFADVNDGQWFTEGVTWAAVNGVVKGYGDGCFGPSDSITREQLAVMLWRYAGSPTAGTSLPFTDAGEASDWARNALNWAVEKGIINGRGNGILDPTGQATRAEAVQMLKNFMETW